MSCRKHKTYLELRQKIIKRSQLDLDDFFTFTGFYN